MKRRQWDSVLYGIAEDQAGYFTAAQARAAGVHQVRLVQLAKNGDVERVSRGVYRFTRFPISEYGHLMEAVLWPQVRRAGVVGVVSHQSALALHDLTDVNPARVHVTLPTAFRVRRTVPKALVIHYADLHPADIDRVHGIPVTTPARTVRDAYASHLGNELVAQAVADGRRSGKLTLSEADWLELEFEGSATAAAPPRRSVPTRVSPVAARHRVPASESPGTGQRKSPKASQLQVRSVSVADVDALVPLVRKYWQFEGIEGFRKAQVTAALRRQLADGHMARGWVALFADRPVGYLLAVYVFSLEHLGLTAEIDEFYVLPEQRGGGAGAALLQAAEAAFVETGCTNVSLQVGHKNDEARAFYGRRGYTPRDGYELLDKALPALKE